MIGKPSTVPNRAALELLGRSAGEEQARLDLDWTKWNEARAKDHERAAGAHEHAASSKTPEARVAAQEATSSALAGGNDDDTPYNAQEIERKARASDFAGAARLHRSAAAVLRAKAARDNARGPARRAVQEARARAMQPAFAENAPRYVSESDRKGLARKMAAARTKRGWSAPASSGGAWGSPQHQKAITRQAEEQGGTARLSSLASIGMRLDLDSASWDAWNTAHGRASATHRKAAGVHQEAIDHLQRGNRDAANKSATKAQAVSRAAYAESVAAGGHSPGETDDEGEGVKAARAADGHSATSQWASNGDMAIDAHAKAVAAHKSAAAAHDRYAQRAPTTSEAARAAALREREARGFDVAVQKPRSRTRYTYTGRQTGRSGY